MPFIFITIAGIQPKTKQLQKIQDKIQNKLLEFEVISSETNLVSNEDEWQESLEHDVSGLQIEVVQRNIEDQQQTPMV